MTGVPDEVKWTSHRPVILAAPDWPDMLALKEHAAGLGADVEVSPLVESRCVRIVWVPRGFTGSTARAAAVQMAGETLARSAAVVADSMTHLASAASDTAESLRSLAEVFEALPPLCLAVWRSAVDGELVACSRDALPGRDWCGHHLDRSNGRIQAFRDRSEAARVEDPTGDVR